MGASENMSSFVGKSGRPTTVVSNYFKMGYKDGMQLNQYRVDYFIELEGGKRKEISTKNRMVHRERFWKFVAAHGQFFKHAPKKAYNLAYDDSHLLYTVNPLAISGPVHELQIVEPINENRTLTIIMTIKPTGFCTINYTDDGFKVLNLILTQLARCPIDFLHQTVHCEISRMFMKPPNNFHQPLEMPSPNGYFFQMLRGLYAFARRGLPAKRGGKTGPAFANYDVTHSAFYKMECDILQFYAFVKKQRFLNEGEQLQLQDYGMNRGQRTELKTLLSGLKLKKKRVAHGIVESESSFCDLIDQTANTHQFDWEGHGRVTVAQYYQQKYGYRIRYPLMPLIQLQPRERRLFLPIEVLKVSDRWQRLRRKLPDELQALTHEFTVTPPAQRFSDIDHMAKEGCHVQQDPFLRTFGVGVDPKFLEVGARVLQPPNCMFSKPFRDLMSMKVVDPPQLGGTPRAVIFDVIVVDRSIDLVNRHANAWQTLVRSCRDRGINLQQLEPLGVTPFDSRPQGRQPLLDRIVELMVQRVAVFKQKLDTKVHMPVFVVALPDNRAVYGHFKAAAELAEKVGIRSQMITSKTFGKLEREGERGHMSSAVARNIFMKINAKCGGVNCRITAPGGSEWTKFVDKKAPTLFIGIDVTHPAPGDTGSPSISALVGNIDPDATRYTATVRAQHHRTEWIEEMGEMFAERLAHFERGMAIFNKTGGANRPAKVVVFRDGVSESQFEGVQDMEFGAMQKVVDEKYGDEGQRPKITFLVVQKRHNTRFYDKNDRDEKNKGNLQPGTVVDGYITSHRKEFYLCSHKGMLGTSRPAHYFVLADQNNFTPDDLEICANNLCYLFARAPMPVSIPAPVYYAHLACYRARHHYAAREDGLAVGEVMQNPNEAVIVTNVLKPTMYFL